MKKSLDSTQQVLIKQIKEDVVDLDYVRFLVGEQELDKTDAENFKKVFKLRGNAIYQDLLFALTLQSFPPRKAKDMWQKILCHKKQLSKRLLRDPGIVVAALDWLSNFERSPDGSYAIVPQAKLESIVHRAAVDGLTTLYDHGSFQSFLHTELQKAKGDYPLSLLMIDIDNFKSVNDTYGHQKGDEVLSKVGKAIKKHSRNMDICGRYGGEEFAVILPQASAAYAAKVAQRIRSKIKTLDTGISVTVSIGVACFPIDSENAEALIRAADDALYQAKQTGKDKVVCATPYLDKICP